MSKEEVTKYLSDNLEISWEFIGGELYIALKLEGKIISKIHFEQS